MLSVSWNRISRVSTDRQKYYEIDEIPQNKETFTHGSDLKDNHTL